MVAAHAREKYVQRFRGDVSNALANGIGDRETRNFAQKSANRLVFVSCRSEQRKTKVIRLH